MTRAEAISSLQSRFDVSRETVARLDRFVELLLLENQFQNLISKASEIAIWDRHILDSAQLLLHCQQTASNWLDVGSGAGFPGIVTALLSKVDHLLVEPRRRRAEFLSEVVAKLNLAGRVAVKQSNVERLASSTFGVISARAVAPVSAILECTHHLANTATTWLLHKGAAATDEVDAARRVWNADFALLPSITSISASIVKVTNFVGRART